MPQVSFSALTVRSQGDDLIVVPSPGCQVGHGKAGRAGAGKTSHCSFWRTEVADFLANSFHELDQMVHPAERAECEQLKSVCFILTVWLRYACSAQLLLPQKQVTKGSLVLGTVCDVSASFNFREHPLLSLASPPRQGSLTSVLGARTCLWLENCIHEYVF